MDEQRSVENSFDSLNDLMRRVNTNPLLKNYIGEFLCNEISHLTNGVTHHLRKQVCEMFSSGLENVTDDFLLQLFSELCFSEGEKENLEAVLLEQVYRWDCKIRFPITYANHFEPAVLMNLTSQENSNSRYRPYTFLTLYDHKYYLDRNPMIVRTMAPQYEASGKKRVRCSDVPMADMAFFVYNSEEIRTSQSRSAIVSVDGEALTRLDLDHNRVKIVERESAKREALYNGIYPAKKYLLPLMSLRRFWQQGFIKFLTHRQERFLTDCGSLISREQYQTLLVQSARFLGDRLSPKQYWTSLFHFPASKSFLDSEAFSAEILSMVNLYRAGNTLKNLPDLKEYYFAFKAMTII
jgi:hypothetical protein